MNKEKFLSKKFIIAFFALVAMCLSIPKESVAQSPSNCKTEEQLVEIADRFGAVFQRLDRVSTVAAILFYDSIPPETKSNADAAALVHMRDGSGVILLGNGGLYCKNAPIPIEFWQTVVKAILGSRS